MTEQEIDQIWLEFHRYGTDLESCEAECMDKEAFIQALSEAVQITRNQALDEAARICSRIGTGARLASDKEHGPSDYLEGRIKGAEDCERAIREHSKSTDLTLINEGNIEQASQPQADRADIKELAARLRQITAVNMPLTIEQRELINTIDERLNAV